MGTVRRTNATNISQAILSLRLIEIKGEISDQHRTAGSLFNDVQDDIYQLHIHWKINVKVCLTALKQQKFQKVPKMHR